MFVSPLKPTKNRFARSKVFKWFPPLLTEEKSKLLCAHWAPNILKRDELRFEQKKYKEWNNNKQLSTYKSIKIANYLKLLFHVNIYNNNIVVVWLHRRSCSQPYDSHFRYAVSARIWALVWRLINSWHFIFILKRFFLSFFNISKFLLS